MPLKWTIDHAQRMVRIAAQGEVTDDEMMELAARMRAYATVMKGGPLCIVVTTPEIFDYARRYINLAQVDRPVQICKSVAEAEAWLTKQKA